VGSSVLFAAALTAVFMATARFPKSSGIMWL
jgi:hypothetical protein